MMKHKYAKNMRFVRIIFFLLALFPWMSTLASGMSSAIDAHEIEVGVHTELQNNSPRNSILNTAKNENCKDPCHEGACHLGHCSFTCLQTSIKLLSYSVELSIPFFSFHKFISPDLDKLIRPPKPA